MKLVCSIIRRGVDILFCGDLKFCDFKGEGVGGVLDVNNSLGKLVEMLCKWMVSVCLFKFVGLLYIRCWWLFLIVSWMCIFLF